MVVKPLDYNLRIDEIEEAPTVSLLRIVEELKKRGADVISLLAGEPGVPPPLEVREELAEALKVESMDIYSYTSSEGIAELREAIAYDLKELGGIDVKPSQIVVTAGGQGAMFSSIASIAKEGEEVILMDPTYFGYKGLLKFFGLKVKHVRALHEKGFQPDVEAIKETVVPGRTKALILVSPDNPTGRVLDKSVAKALAELAQDYKFWILYDEPYKTLVYEGEHVYLYELAPENVLALNAFSKDPGIPGWRLGYVYGPEWIMKKVALASEISVYNPPSFAQLLVLAYLKNRELRRRHIERVKRLYVARRDAMVEEMEKLKGVRFVKPRGAMFLFVDFSIYLEKTKMTSRGLAEKLLLEKHVATVPGSFFGESTEGYLRLTFTTETPDRIREGVRRIKMLLEEL
ncbi:MAG: aminotransferase class I/II-fold pyridoxal phosphate-dependent enzyme [Acidilobaceae archaeon]